jgi:hypothetical protein
MKSRTLVVLLLLLSSVLGANAESPLTVRQITQAGKTANISIPENFLPTPSKDPERTTFFMDKDVPANVGVANLREPITETDVASPDIVQDIKVRLKQGRFLGSSVISLPGNRKALRAVIEVPGTNALMRQIRFFVQGDPGWNVIFTTTAEKFDEYSPKFDTWIKTFRAR